MTEGLDVDEVLEEAIAKLAKRAAGTQATSHVLALASAVRQLAEARAWCISPGNAHGGNGAGDS